MDIIISRNGTGKIGNFIFKCCLGIRGVTDDKSEGDLKTPRGIFPLRYIMYRKDKIKKLKVNLSIYSINKNHICCEDPDNINYNKICIKKEMNETESLWRKDSSYDIIIIIGYNDQPVQKGKGSAIFIHLATNKYKPTKGCIALQLKDMKKLLSYNLKNIKII